MGLRRYETTAAEHKLAREKDAKSRELRIKGAFADGFGDSFRVRLKKSVTGLAQPQEEDKAPDTALGQELNVSSTEIDHMKSVFSKIDQDGDGMVDFGEFSHTLGKLLNMSHIAPEDTRKIWERLCPPPEREVPFEIFAEWY